MLSPQKNSSKELTRLTQRRWLDSLSLRMTTNIDLAKNFSSETLEFLFITGKHPQSEMIS